MTCANCALNIERNVKKLLGVNEASGVSKWKQMIERIENDATLRDQQFQSAWKQIGEDMRQWRVEFELKHDREVIAGLL